MPGSIMQLDQVPAKDGRWQSEQSVYLCSPSRSIEKTEKQFFSSFSHRDKRGGNSNSTETVGKQMHNGKPQKLNLE